MYFSHETHVQSTERDFCEWFSILHTYVPNLPACLLARYCLCCSGCHVLRVLPLYGTCDLCDRPTFA